MFQRLRGSAPPAATAAFVETVQGCQNTRATLAASYAAASRGLTMGDYSSRFLCYCAGLVLFGFTAFNIIGPAYNIPVTDRLRYSQNYYFVIVGTFILLMEGPASGPLAPTVLWFRRLIRRYAGLLDDMAGRAVFYGVQAFLVFAVYRHTRPMELAALLLGLTSIMMLVVSAMAGSRLAALRAQVRVAAGASDAEQGELERVFKKYDADGSNTISAEELNFLMKDITGSCLGPSRLEAAMRSMDADQTGDIGLREFIVWFQVDGPRTKKEAERAVRACEAEVKAAEAAYQTGTGVHGAVDASKLRLQTAKADLAQQAKEEAAAAAARRAEEAEEAALVVREKASWNQEKVARRKATPLPNTKVDFISQRAGEVASEAQHFLMHGHWTCGGAVFLIAALMLGGCVLFAMDGAAQAVVATPAAASAASRAAALAVAPAAVPAASNAAVALQEFRAVEEPSRVAIKGQKLQNTALATSVGATNRVSRHLRSRSLRSNTASGLTPEASLIAAFVTVDGSSFAHLKEVSARRRDLLGAQLFNGYFLLILLAICLQELPGGTFLPLVGGMVGYFRLCTRMRLHALARPLGRGLLYMWQAQLAYCVYGTSSGAAAAWMQFFSGALFAFGAIYAALGYLLNAKLERAKVALRQKMANGGVVKPEQIQNAFRSADKDRSGVVDIKELGAMCAELGVEMSVEDLLRARDAMDIDGNGVISLSEFHAWFDAAKNEPVPFLEVPEDQRDLSKFQRLRRMLQDGGWTTQSLSYICGLAVLLQMLFAIGVPIWVPGAWEQLDLGIYILDFYFAFIGLLVVVFESDIRSSVLRVYVLALRGYCAKWLRALDVLTGRGLFFFIEGGLMACAFFDYTHFILSITGACLAFAGLCEMTVGILTARKLDAQKAELHAKLGGDLAKLRINFDGWDTDRNGALDSLEFSKLCMSLGKELDKWELMRAIDVLDANKTGMIDFDEFAFWYTYERPRSVKEAEQGVTKAEAALATAKEKGETRLFMEQHQRSLQEAKDLVKQLRAEEAAMAAAREAMRLAAEAHKEADKLAAQAALEVAAGKSKADIASSRAQAAAERGSVEMQKFVTFVQHGHWTTKTVCFSVALAAIAISVLHLWTAPILVLLHPAFVSFQVYKLLLAFAILMLEMPQQPECCGLPLPCCYTLGMALSDFFMNWFRVLGSLYGRGIFYFTQGIIAYCVEKYFLLPRLNDLSLIAVGACYVLLGLKTSWDVASVRGRLAAALEAEGGVSEQRLEAAFVKYDKDGSGYIDQVELGKLCTSLGLTLSTADLERAMFALDEGHNGIIGKPEFMGWFTTLNMPGK